ncbi:glycosyltransferase family 2 protein [Coriobacteriia bacterium Es71-Z0120]|uniref:glycosyltransferase family 2 protein n=1 Tax=Parvivirga hydrogeniphila TaxID=2939460 RepID=UPI002260AC7F|nr:glycosyltransferase family 2 protein [Parvivirga hydrogeniphila]MCL4078942.1 glycosyltransferase family 2 protein [Parvivirga hydrogeniphila]
MTDALVLPVYNEARTVEAVLSAVREVFDGVVVVVDDGSTDDTPRIVNAVPGVVTLCHEENRGYGRSLIDGFEAAFTVGADRIVTMDCDGQHEPAHIPAFLAALERADIVSGSRYLPESGAVGATPPDRMRVNAAVTKAINRVTRWGITDAFCGFKAYRAASLRRLRLTEDGYAMPIQLWAEAWKAGLSVCEIAIERIYCDADRSFGADLDDPGRRLAYYLSVWENALKGTVGGGSGKEHTHG